MIGIKNNKAPITPKSQHGQNKLFLSSFTSIKDNLRKPRASVYSLEIKYPVIRIFTGTQKRELPQNNAIGKIIIFINIDQPKSFTPAKNKVKNFIFNSLLASG